MSEENIAASEDEPVPESPAATLDEVDLPLRDALTSESASELLAERDATVVSLAGPYNSGKTTLLTSIYEVFRSECRRIRGVQGL